MTRAITCADPDWAKAFIQRLLTIELDLRMRLMNGEMERADVPHFTGQYHLKTGNVADQEVSVLLDEIRSIVTGLGADPVVMLRQLKAFGDMDEALMKYRLNRLRQ